MHLNFIDYNLVRSELMDKEFKLDDLTYLIYVRNTPMI